MKVKQHVEYVIEKIKGIHSNNSYNRRYCPLDDIYRVKEVIPARKFLWVERPESYRVVAECDSLEEAEHTILELRGESAMCIALREAEETPPEEIGRY